MSPSDENILSQMASIHQIRGSLLEEVVLLLLARSGYRRVQVGEEGTRNGRAGLEVEGRGTVHQIDALVTPFHSHAFLYPIRLLVEAKCEASPLGLAVVRSVLGSVFDINQNYFAGRLPDGRELRMQRFNYHAAILAANGYSANAEQYALAHQVFLIDYSHVGAMRPVVDALLTLEVGDFRDIIRRGGRRNLTTIRRGFRSVLEDAEVNTALEVFSEQGSQKLNERLIPAIRELRGSYYGMIEGIYPVHLISRREIPSRVLRERPVIPCEIRVSEDEQVWAFEPSEISRESPDFFHLEFAIPEFIADMLNARTEQHLEGNARWVQIANIKQRYLRFVDITTISEGQLLGVRLALDVNWLNRYLESLRLRDERRLDRRE
jgi:hypothetical protein